MGSLRLRWGIRVVVAALPLAAIACTSDQFVGADGGSDATTSDAPTADAPATGDGAVSDAPTAKDSSILDGALCVYDGGALETCSNTTTCFSGTHYCNVGACTFLPDPCACDHSCNCVEKLVPDPCAGGDAGSRQCSDQNGYVVVSCGP